MIFKAPTPFAEALQSRQVRALLPSELSSAEFRAIDQQLLRYATLSARTSNAKHLQRISDFVDSILNPQTVDREGRPVTEGMNVAAARTRLKAGLQEDGYLPTPGEAGTIKDLSSDQRLNLVIKTNVEMAQGFGHWQQSQDEDVLDGWPAQELFRAEARKEERDWLTIWRGAGGSLFDGRMIALKNDPIWNELGNADDGLGNPWPPYRFNSGMWVRDVSRVDAERFGLLTPGQRVAPQRLDFDAALSSNSGALAEPLKGALLESLGPDYTFDGDVLRRVA